MVCVVRCFLAGSLRGGFVSGLCLCLVFEPDVEGDFFSINGADTLNSSGCTRRSNRVMGLGGPCGALPTGEIAVRFNNGFGAVFGRSTILLGNGHCTDTSGDFKRYACKHISYIKMLSSNETLSLSFANTYHTAGTVPEKITK